MTGSRLAGLARRRAASAAPSGSASAGAAEQRCDMCAEPVPEEHRHLLDLAKGDMLCVCRPCSILFDRRQAGGAHYRLIPDRRVRVDGAGLDDVAWAALGIPVDMAFFVRSSTAGRAVAFYPSPLGTMHSALPLEAWERVAAADPALAGMAEDVEALLVHRARGARDAWVVPLSDCYRLVAVVRAHWKGISGGDDVTREIARFFASLPAAS